MPQIFSSELKELKEDISLIAEYYGVEISAELEEAPESRKTTYEIYCMSAKIADELPEGYKLNPVYDKGTGSGNLREEAKDILEGPRKNPVSSFTEPQALSIAMVYKCVAVYEEVDNEYMSGASIPPKSRFKEEVIEMVEGISEALENQ